MSQLFRESHLFKILDSFEGLLGNLPLDVFLSGYFRAHKAVGAKDRRFISEAVYSLVRWRGLLDHLSGTQPSWKKRYEIYQHHDLLTYLSQEKIPLHIRASFPKSLFQLIASSYGEEKALEFCIACNAPAPTTVRVNILKTTRESLLKKWEGIFSVSPCLHSPHGIIFHQKTNFFALPEFKEGLFEIQDEGSQLIAWLLQAKPGDQVLDFCAGSGGKTLAFAPSMEHRGQIYLHDIRSHALEEAKKRLRRAGIQNAQLLFHDDPKKNRLKQKMDWVLVDAPCSGTGTLRRNPDMKWKFDPSAFEHLVEEQRKIFAEALEFLHPKGKIVYATCSILPKENEEQIAFFQNHFRLSLVNEPFRSFPQKGGMDGFFGAVLQRIPLQKQEVI